MHTECPVCFRTLTVTTKQLHAENSVINCSHCSASFDTLQHLCANLPPELKKDPLRIRKKAPFAIPTWLWGLGTIIVLWLLMIQIIYFKQQSWLNNPSVRIWVNGPCKILHCHLPPFKQIHKLKITKSSLLPLASNKYLLAIKLNNHAPLAQSAPSIKLSLIDFKGAIIAERIFDPDEYQLSPDDSEIEPNQTYSADLSLWIPHRKIGGHRVEFF
ncbi:MAG: DUF3426 domain-containing protein [Methylococcaceae bacterium]